MPHVTQLDTTDRRAVREFIRLPFRLYREYPLWVPPLLPGEWARFEPDFPYYTHSEAAFFLAHDDQGRAVGRIAVLEHRPHNEHRGASDALVSLYEAANDDAVAAGLFSAAAQWASDRGLTHLVGPKGFITADGLGLLVEGFDVPPAVSIPYNPDYYVRQWEEVGGFAKLVDYLSPVVRREDIRPDERLMRLAKKIRERRGFTVPHFENKQQLREYIEPVKEAYNAAFAHLWAYTPIPDRDVEAIFDRLMLLISDPNLVTLVFKGDDLVGFQFIYPDITPAIRWARGRLWPFGVPAILWVKQRTKAININGNAVLPQYQGLGANAILYEAMLNAVYRNKYTYSEAIQIEENNKAMLEDVDLLTDPYRIKRHRVYGREL